MDIAFNITKKCNKGCDYCYIDLTGEDLPFEELKKITNSVNVNTVTLTGGEPLTHPNIEEILSFISNKNIHTHLLTNGISLHGKLLEKIAETGAELFVTYNTPDEKIKKNLEDSYMGGLEVNIHHLLTDQTLPTLNQICEEINFAKSILLLYPTNVGKDNVKMYSPEEWFSLLNRATEITSKHGIKTYFEQAFTERNSELGINPPCPTGEDIFIDVNAESYPCCLLVDLVDGYKGIKPIKFNPDKCNFLRKNKLSYDSKYIRICPIAITNSYDGSFKFPSHLGEK